MTLLLKNGRLFLDRRFVPADVLITDGSVFVFDRERPCGAEADRVIDLDGKDILPGFADVHVHFREPGFSYKETIKTGSMAAAAGGYTAVCPMPNIKPVPSSLEALKVELDIIKRDALIPVIPYGAITKLQDGKSELSDMEAMVPYVAAFSDDGCGVQEGARMRDAMELAKSLGKLIVAHAEDKSYVEPGGAIHLGKYASEHGLIGISSDSEWRQVERDVKLSDETGCGYHVCHVSTKESVEIIREAKKSGVNVTCETAPHYLTLTEDDLQDEGRFKMNPPVREKADREALREAAFDGTVDMIATDHAPHTAEEKSKGLAGSLFGIVGLETAFPVLYTRLVQEGILPYERLIELLTSAPRKRFGLPGAEALTGGSFKEVQSESAGGGCEGNVAYTDKELGIRRIWSDLTVVDTEASYEIDSSKFKSMGHATPFDHELVKGEIFMTISGGEIVFEK